MHSVFRLFVAVAWIVIGISSAQANVITIEHSVNSGHGQPYLDATRQIAELFNQEQDAIRVEVTWTSSYDDVMRTRIAGGASPDTMTTNRLGELASLDLLLPLDSYLERDGLEKQFVPATLEQGRWAGKLVQMPMTAQPGVTYYNTWLFQEAGVESPNDLDDRGLWDWDGIVNAGKKIARDTTGNGVLDIWGAAGPWYSMERFIFWLGQSGGYYFDRMSNPSESRLASPEVARALEFVHSLAHESRVTEVSGITSGAAHNKFFDGQLGMLFDGPWRIAGIRGGIIAEGAWDVAPMPTGPAGRPAFIHTDGVQISKMSPHPDAAWEWIRFLTTDPRAIRMLSEATGRPAAAIEGLREYVHYITISGNPVHGDIFLRTLITAEQAIPIVPLVGGVQQFFAAHSRELLAYFSGNQSLGETIERLDLEFMNLLQDVSSQ